MITVGSLFAGIGGIELGLERTGGFKTIWQVEIDPYCQRVLAKHWPDVRRWDDVRTWPQPDTERVDLICGGDPCPKHSRARSNGESKHPDLSGYFLAVVGRCRPRWVVRENVPAPTVRDFHAALEAVGYGAVVVRLNASEATGQSRQRDFVVGRLGATGKQLFREVFPGHCYGEGAYTTRLGTRQIAPALTCHRTRYDSRDCYIWEEGRPLRLLVSQERARLAGFPDNWIAGLSPAACANKYGNAVVPQVAQWIGERILEAEEG